MHGTDKADYKERMHSSVRAISAMFKLLGWINLGLGIGFSLTLFTFAVKSEADTDKIISLAGGLVCVLLTIIAFVISYGFAEAFRMLLEIGEESETIAKRITEVADRIEIESEEQSNEPKIEEIEPPPAE